MPTQEDFRTARGLAIETLSKLDIDECCKKAGVSFETASSGKRRIIIPYLGKTHELIIGDKEIAFDEGSKAIKLPDQVLMLHYLTIATGAPVENKCITFREVPSGPFYYPSFVKRAITPLVKCFGDNPERLKMVAGKIGELAGKPGDMALRVLALPRVPIVLSLWKGDDEFPPEGNVYFDVSVASYLSTEDTAYLAGSVVYTTIGIFRSMTAS
jgi:hypothetical protein